MGLIFLCFLLNFGFFFFFFFAIMSVSYLIGSLCFSTSPPPPPEWKPRNGGRGGTPLGGEIGKVGPAPRGRRSLPRTRCWGWGSQGGTLPTPTPLPLSPTLELGTGLRRFYFLPRAPAEKPSPCVSAPVLLCFGGMCFHLKKKQLLNGALFISCFKN